MRAGWRSHCPSRIVTSMKWGRLLFLLLIVAAVALWLLPGMLDGRFNEVSGTTVEVSAPAAQLHSRVPVVDLHADPLLWSRDLSRRHDHGHIDVPRLRAGNVALQVFGLVTKSPRGQNFDRNPSDSDRITALMIAQRRPPSTWTSLLQRALHQSAALDELITHQGGLRWVRNRSELTQLLQARQRGESAIGAMLGVEGAHALEGDPANLQTLHDAGLRMLGLAHFFDNEFAGSAHGTNQGGLTDKGRALMTEAQRLNMIIDLSHSSTAVIDEVLDSTTLPVLFSHTGVNAICPGPRNLTDEQLKRAAARGAIFGIALFPGAICSEDLPAVVASMKHVRDTVGIQHVALGSDFDGAVSTPIDAAGLPALTQAMLDAGFGESEIRQVMNANALRYFARHLPP